MALAETFQQALDIWEWDDQIVHSDGGETFLTVETPYDIEGQTHSLTIMVYPDKFMVRFILRSPIRIPSKRLPVAYHVLNYLNSNLWMGFYVTVGEDDAEIIYMVTSALDGTEGSVEQFHRLRAESYEAFNEQKQRVFQVIAHSEMSAENIISALEE